ncbi:MAG: DUF2007 domain-containing protein [bacterium]|nr:DUF2007 domain-containing protein [bacterium]
MNQDLITVDRFSDPATAGLAQSRLEAADIPSFLSDEVTMGLAWHWNMALGGIQLQVPPEHAHEARLLLEDPGDPAAGGGRTRNQAPVSSWPGDRCGPASWDGTCRPWCHTRCTSGSSP